MSQGDPTSTELPKEVETLRTQLEQERAVTGRLLRLDSSPCDLHGLMREATLLLCEWSGCEAVGIRLRDGDDFPYFETRGFPRDFIQAENTLCVRDLDGQLARDLQGNAVPECMCGNILSGRFNSALPFFTPDGSFWTNSTTELLASTTEADRQARTRNRCNGEGYESVALIPLRSGGTTFGLLQLNDRRAGRFTIEKITVLEGLAVALGEATARRQSAEKLHKAHQALSETEQHLASIYDTVGDVVFQLAVGKGGRYRFTSVNRAFLATTGLTPEQVVGKRVDEVIPEPSLSMVLEKYAAAIREKGIVRWEETSEYPTGTLTGEVSIAPVVDEAGHCTHLVGAVHDITDRKRAERALRESEERYRTLFRQAADSIVIIDTESGALTEFNDRTCQSLGYTREEFEKLKIPDFDVNESPEEVAGHIEKIARERGDHFETRHRTQAGDIRDVEVSSSVISVGGRDFIQSIWHDVTE
ncbi:MAG: PAS domain S-box protein, partial [Planctomycetes bacterium]|nr:PAS domain S-box protein [Planctomycetota bacterium]